MWSNENTFPTPEKGFVDGPIPLGIDTASIPGLIFEGTVTRTHTEWDSHYLRFSYLGINFVAELNTDAGPYVNVQHDQPCMGLGVNERIRGNLEVKCGQTGRPEAVKVNRSFSIDFASGPVTLWGSFHNEPQEQLQLEFGQALLGMGLTEEEYRDAATVVTEGLRDLTCDPAAVWWPVWNARAY